MDRNSVHPQSSIAPLSQFELWGIPPTQVSVMKDVEVEYRPLTSVKNDTQAEFNIILAQDEYLNLSESYLVVRAQVRVVKDDVETNNIDTTKTMTKDLWDTIYPCNYFLHSIFSQIDVSVGGKEITLCPQTYPFRAYLEALLGFSQDAKKSFLTASMWLEKGERNLLIRPSDPTSFTGKVFEMAGLIHTDLTFQDRLILGGCEIKVKLTPERSKFYFQAGEGLSPILDIKDISIYGHISKCYPMLTVAHSKALSIAPARYPITRVEVKRQGIPAGSLDCMLDNVIRGQLPRRIFVVLVDTDTFNGSYKKNPFSFHHNDVNYAAAYIDGNQYPAKPYQPDFSNNLYVREYMALFQALNQNHSDAYCNLTYYDFGNKNTIFTFNFSPDLSNGPGNSGHVSCNQFGTLRLHFRFKNMLEVSLNVLVYAEFDNLIEIDETRQALTNFN